MHQQQIPPPLLVVHLGQSLALWFGEERARVVDGVSRESGKAVERKAAGCREVVVAGKQDVARLQEQVEASAWISAVADTVAEAQSRGDADPIDVVLHRLKRGEIGVHIAEDGDLQGELRRARTRPRPPHLKAEE